MIAGKAALPGRFPQAKHRPGIIGLEKSSGYELPELPFPALPRETSPRRFSSLSHESIQVSQA
jgi:hypothetical protein